MQLQNNISMVIIFQVRGMEYWIFGWSTFSVCCMYASPSILYSCSAFSYFCEKLPVVGQRTQDNEGEEDREHSKCRFQDSNYRYEKNSLHT